MSQRTPDAWIERNEYDRDDRFISWEEMDEARELAALDEDVPTQNPAVCDKCGEAYADGINCACPSHVMFGLDLSDRDFKRAQDAYFNSP